MRFRLIVPAVFTALIVTLFAIPNAEAGCQHVSYQYAVPAYVAPTYATPFVLSQPYAVPVAVNSNFFSVAPDLAQLRVNQELVQAAADRAAQKSLEQFIAAMKANGLIAPNALGPNPGGAGPFNPGVAVSATKADKIQAIVNAKCISCHNADGKNGINLTDVNKLTEIQLHKFEHRVMKDPTDPKMMPRPKSGTVATPITNQELNDVNAWVDEASAKLSAPAPMLPPVPSVVIPEKK